MANPLYLPATEMLKFYDNRRLFEVLKDDGTAATTANYATNANLNQAIISSEAEFDMAVQVGRHYDKQTFLDAVTTADAALPGSPTADEVLQNALAVRRIAPLRELVADLAYGRLMARRGYGAAAMDKLSPKYAVALEKLRALADGRAVFDFDENLTAGVPTRVTIGKTLPLRINNLFGYWDSNASGYLYTGGM